MRIRSRIVAALIALGYCVWASATMVRHFAGWPDASLTWLFVSPAVGCIGTLLGLTWELAQHGDQAVGWREVSPVAIWLQYGGLALVGWRALWMFFSWDGMMYFPAWCLLALGLYRWHPRWVPIT